jgi:ADP-heptose:LPS heptosyltransferase
LLSERGFSCAVLGQPERSNEAKELIAKGVQWLPTPTIADAVSAVSSGLGMITVDTGLMHLAVQQLCPTVALHQKRSVYARTEQHCRPIFSPDCSSDCQNKTFVPPNLDVVFREYEYMQFLPCFANQGERCMEQIKPATVFEQFVGLLGSVGVNQLSKVNN